MVSTSEIPVRISERILSCAHRAGGTDMVNVFRSCLRALMMKARDDLGVEVSICYSNPHQGFHALGTHSCLILVPSSLGGSASRPGRLSAYGYEAGDPQPLSAKD